MSEKLPKILITGGAGFIGSALCRMLVGQGLARVVNVDKLTYAASLSSLSGIDSADGYELEVCDITDAERLAYLFRKHQPDGVIHLAAESHVDRSIDGASDFIATNLVGTYRLLEAARSYWERLDIERRKTFRFLHVSTDEVYGALGEEGFFTEESVYDPSSPYSASKAGADHLVKAWHRTYGLPTLVSHASNNYGPYQFPEKLIPRMIVCCDRQEPLPVYARGENVRDWLHVDDHVKALWLIYAGGRIGESYNVGGRNERKNIEVVRGICELMDRYSHRVPIGGHGQLIRFVADRPGHDLRYAVDSSKIERELGWKAERCFDSGLEETVKWYLEHRSWWEDRLAK